MLSHDCTEDVDWDQTMSFGGKQGAGARPAKNAGDGIAELAKLVSESPTAESACEKIATILRVERTEVALLRIEKGTLHFVYPAELRAAGVIPMSSSAVAARTASTRTSFLSNSFAKVKHASLFECVKLGAPGEQVSEQPPIQKIMSVPITGADGQIVGVVQVSRKGLDPSLSGKDFSNEELKQLEQIATILSRMSLIDGGSAGQS